MRRPQSPRTALVATSCLAIGLALAGCDQEPAKVRYHAYTKARSSYRSYELEPAAGAAAYASARTTSPTVAFLATEESSAARQATGAGPATRAVGAKIGSQLEEAHRPSQASRPTLGTDGPTLTLTPAMPGRAADPDGAIEGSEEASIDGAIRFVPSTRPDQPEPQHPPKSTPENVDTGQPPHEWQRATDDWLGARPWLDDRGLSFQGNWTIDASKSLRGGADTAGSATRNLFNANLTLDTQRLLGWAGGTLFVNFQNHAGRNGSDLAGDAQGFSNIDADGRTQLSEAWYEQKAFGELLSVRAGKIDANAQFANVAGGAEFLNSSMGKSPTIAFMPSYPDPSFGADVFVRPAANWYAGVGVFDGAGARGVATGSRGPATLFGPPSDLFLIGEAGVTWELAGRRAGRLAAGAWHQTGRLAKFDGNTVGGATGPYLVLEQALWRANPADDKDARGLDAFLQYGHADRDVSPFVDHVGGGVTWTGMLPGRDDDVLGLGATWARLSDAPGAGFTRDDELAVELFYKWRALKWLSVKPDLQYIHNPAGGDRAQHDAWVATLRVQMDL